MIDLPYRRASTRARCGRGRNVLRSTDLLESTGGFSLGGFSSLCCFAALGRDHHLALPAGASAFAVAVCIATVDSVGKFRDRPGCQQPLTALGPGLLLWALAWDFPPLRRGGISSTRPRFCFFTVSSSFSFCLTQQSSLHHLRREQTSSELWLRL